MSGLEAASPRSLARSFLLAVALLAAAVASGLLLSTRSKPYRLARAAIVEHRAALDMVGEVRRAFPLAMKLKVNGPTGRAAYTIVVWDGHELSRVGVELRKEGGVWRLLEIGRAGRRLELGEAPGE